MRRRRGSGCGSCSRDCGSQGPRRCRTGRCCWSTTWPARPGPSPWPPPCCGTPAPDPCCLSSATGGPDMLVYTAIASLDGYVADSDGAFDWATPSEEVHAAVNDLERRVSTHLLGRRMYEVLAAWETMPVDDAPAVIRDYAGLWHDRDKVVYS